MNTVQSKIKPIIYEENKVRIVQQLTQGDIEYLDMSSWSYQDQFFAFFLGLRFFEVCGATYPSPRKKEEVPVWFLLCCAVQMRMHTSSVYSKLPGLLKNGPILSRIKFNVGGFNGGFNNKNRKERTCPVDFDCVRKFFKTTDAALLRYWYNNDIVKFLRQHRAFDKHGIFILDQTHVVVPDNENYKGSVLMKVDEYGHRYDTDRMTIEQINALPTHRCYTLSQLIHIGKDEQCFIVAGYHWGPGNADEFEQANPILKNFVNTVGKHVMKLLIVDRGYIDGRFIDYVYNTLGSDILIPLKKNMDMYRSAITVVESKEWIGTWMSYQTYEKDGVTYHDEVSSVDNYGLWDNCSVNLHITIMRTTNLSTSAYGYWVLATTFKPQTPKELFELYALRTEIEERHRQLKLSWHINEFSSPHESLVEAHVLFTLLTYTLIQLHLVKKHLSQLTSKTIDTLKSEERIGANSVIVYHKKYFAVFDLDEYTYIIADMELESRQKLKKWIERQKKMFRPSG